MVRIDEPELKALPYNVDSIRIPKELGGGYMASPEIYHQLHCLVSSQKEPCVSALIGSRISSGRVHIGIGSTIEQQWNPTLVISRLKCTSVIFYLPFLAHTFNCRYRPLR